MQHKSHGGLSACVVGSILWRRGIANLSERTGLRGAEGSLAVKRVWREMQGTLCLEAGFIMAQRPRRARGAYKSPVGLVT